MRARQKPAPPGRHKTLSRQPDLAGAAWLVRSGLPVLDRAWLRSAYGLDGTADALIPAMAIAAVEVPDFTPTPLFDPAWVRRWMPAAPDSVFAMLEQYLAVGERACVSPNPFFPPALYRAALPDVASPLLHALTHGRFGAVYFDDAAYRAGLGGDADHLAARGLPPFAHYVVHGWRAGLPATPLFDEAWYLSRYPDAQSWPNGFSHFLHMGEAEGRQPNPFFDPAAYLETNPDIASRIADGTLWSAFRYWHDGGRPEGWRNRGQPAPAAASVCAFMQDSFPGGADRDALLAAGDAYAASGVIPPGLRAAAAAVYRRRAQPIVAIDTPDLPNPLPGDPACRAHLSGIAVLPFHRLTGVEIGAADPGIVASVIQLHRVPLAEFLEEDPFGLAIHGELCPGFLLELAVAVLPGVTAAQAVWLRFLFTGGRDALRRVVIMPGERPPAPPPAAVEAEVCLAAYAPPARQFVAQCRSVLAQNGALVRLLISDDATPPARAAGLQAGRTAAGAVVSVAPDNRGFVANFERAIRMAPAGRPVLLADQDDCWHPDKARTLLDRLQPGVALAFSDMRVADADGVELSPTFWRQRVPHWRNPISLAAANTVTGAASALSPALVQQALPFPRYRAVFHDMWLAVAAAASGTIVYEPRALYDYVQHGGNEIGFAGSRRSTDARWGLAVRLLHRMAATPPADWTAGECDAWLAAGTLARDCLAPRWVLLSAALQRFPAWRDGQARQDAQTVLALLGGTAPPRAVRAAWRRVRRDGQGQAGLIGLDRMLAAALGAGQVARLCDTAAASARLAAHLWRSRQGPAQIVAAPARTARGYVILLPDLHLPAHRVPSFAAATYLRLALADRLMRAGASIRLLVPGTVRVAFEQVASLTAYFPEFTRLLSAAPLLADGEAIPLGPQEALVATDHATGDIADALARSLSRAGALHLVTGDDPAAGWDWAASGALAGRVLVAGHLTGLAGLAIHVPCVAPAPGAAGPPVVLVWLDASDPHCLHGLSLAALRLAVAQLGPAAQAWRFVAVGTASLRPVALAAGVWLYGEPGFDRRDYAALLGRARAGLVLAAGAQHSAIALEMAAAGLAVVSAAPKASDAPGVVAAVPASAAVAAALLAAMKRRRRAPRAATAAPGWADAVHAMADALTTRRRR